MNSLAIPISNNLINTNSSDLVFNDNLLNRFIAYTDVKDSTMQGYIVCLRNFFKYLYDNDIKQPNRQDIRDYKKYLDKSKLTAGTKNQYFRAVKHLFKWLSSENIYNNVADNLKGFKVDTDNHKKDYFKEQDIIKILNKIDTTNQVGKRDYAIIMLMITAGLRVNEIRNIDIEDIDIIDNKARVFILGKGHNEKDTPKEIIEPVYDAIKDYLDSKGKPTTGALFTSTSNRALNKRITKESISYILKQRFINAGYDSKRLTPHSLRHSSNTIYYHSCNDIYKVQQHARHKDPKTTEIYIHTEDRDNLHSERDIYNQIFKPNDKDTINDIKSSIVDLDTEHLKKVLEYIKTIK